MFDLNPGGPDDGAPPPLNRLAVVGLVLFGAVGFLALFAAPLIQQVLQTEFLTAFWIVSVVEFVAAVGAGISAYWLYGARDGE